MLLFLYKYLFNSAVDLLVKKLANDFNFKSVREHFLFPRTSKLYRLKTCPRALGALRFMLNPRRSESLIYRRIYLQTSEFKLRSPIHKVVLASNILVNETLINDNGLNL